MHRPGINLDAVLPTDLLCDFCTRPWDGEFPMIEGHRGSCICGDCLSSASLALVQERLIPEVAQCVLCLRTDRNPIWKGQDPSSASACRGCIRRSARLMAAEPDVVDETDD